MSDDIKTAKYVLEQEIEGLQALIDSLDESFSAAVDLLFNTKGRVILSGMGKSGHIARKIAATMASTGTPAMFVHPGEASHGDLGMVTKDDVLILLSNSGETSELGDIIRYSSRFDIPIIAMVRKKSSSLVEAAKIAFVLPEIPEASPVEAPTTSTTMMLAWGDALSISLLEKRGFSKEDFHVFHPGGKLGSGLLKVAQLMRKEDDLPVVSENSAMSEALIEITSKSLGCTAVVNDSGKLTGIITDGDLRRHMSDDLTQKTASEVMTKDPVTISSSTLSGEAMKRMNEKSITSLFVVDKELVGVVHIHDLLRAGVA